MTVTFRWCIGFFQRPGFSFGTLFASLSVGTDGGYHEVQNTDWRQNRPLDRCVVSAVARKGEGTCSKDEGATFDAAKVAAGSQMH
jgi:hypothetical protein